MSMRTQKSTITCDLEGRVETFNKGAESIFGYTAAEVIGRKRVSLFSPGLVVLAHVPNWLKTAREQGEFAGEAVFIRKNGSRFPARIRITPTFKDGRHVGYCGVTTPVDASRASANPSPVGPLTRLFAFLVITRLPFLTASMVPVLLGASWAVVRHQLSPFPWLLFVLTLFGAMALHVAANTFNDYFDWTSGTDQVNNDYFLPYSGGSRSMELGLISEKGMLQVALASLGIATALGLVVLYLSGQPLLVLFGLMGAVSGYFYTAPPLRLVARKGLGELLIGLNFGPLMTAGTVLALTGSVGWSDFLVGVPVGLLTTAILWINQFPDEAADRISGKHNLVVVLGGKRARWGYAALVAGAFVIGIGGVLTGEFPAGMLAILAALPLAASAIRVTFQHYQHRELVTANARTVYLQMAAGLLAAAGPLLPKLIGK